MCYLSSRCGLLIALAAGLLGSAAACSDRDHPLAPTGYAPLSVSEAVSNGITIQIYKDADVDGPREESVLEELGFVKGTDFEVRPTSDLQSGIPMNTRVIILVSNVVGPTATANVNHPDAQANLNLFVQNGGVLVAHLADVVEGSSYLIPGLPGPALDEPMTNAINLIAPTHPIALGPDEVAGTSDDWTQANIQWSSSCCAALGSLPALPAGAIAIMDAEGAIVFADYPFGSGRVIVTTSPLEFGYAEDPGVSSIFWYASPRRMLRNELYYATHVVPTHVDSLAPKVTNLTANSNPVAVGNGVTITARVDDSESGGSHISTAEYSLDGDPFVAMTAQDGSFDSAIEDVEVSLPSFPESGVHELCVRATDVAENTSSAECILLAVYDPSAGFVTGAGWIDSPEGAYVADPSMTGIARFAFIAKYQKGANVPLGNTQFVFKTGDLDFRSTSYDWLVVSGARAQFKGNGTINGVGAYEFLLTAIDGQLNGGGGTDRFRIKIWDPTSGSILYDNKLGASDTGSDATVLGGGTITIHSE